MSVPPECASEEGAQSHGLLAFFNPKAKKPLSHIVANSNVSGATDRQSTFEFLSKLFSFCISAFNPLLDQETDVSLRKLLNRDSINEGPLAKKLLECAQVDWPSIIDARASFEPEKTRYRRPSLVRRIISSVLKRKKLIHA
jgi:hypothetical protein